MPISAMLIQDSEGPGKHLFVALELGMQGGVTCSTGGPHIQLCCRKN